MMNNNKKKNFKRTIIFIIICVVVVNLLLSFVFGAKAADKDDLEYIPFGQFELVNTVDNQNVYKVTLPEPLQDITLALIMINPTGTALGSVFYDEEGSYVIQERFVKDTSYQDNQYNAYSANCIYIIKSITITVSSNLVIDGLYIIPNNTSVDYNTVISAKLSQLNRQKYIVQTIDIGYDEFNSVHYESSIIYPYEIYLNQQSRLLFISGQVAITGGVNKYIYTVNNSTPKEITNNNAGQSVTSDFITEVNNANFGIIDYNNNANFDFGIVLLSYENQTVSVTISAVGYDGIVYDLIYIPEVHVYNEIDESETEIETETETDIPIEPGEGSYKDGYDKGYQEAFRDMLNGNLVGGKIEYNLHKLDTGVIKSYTREILTAPYVNPNYLPTNGLSLKQVYDDWIKFGGTLNEHLVSTQIYFKNPVFIQFNRLLITLPDSCITDGKPNVIIYAIINDETAPSGYQLKATYFGETSNKNQWRINFNIEDEYIAGIQITNIFPSGAKDTYIKFDTGVYALHEFSYNQGLIEGQTRVNSNAYTEGKKDGWEIGFYKGYEEAQKDKNFLVSCITSVFDAFLLLVMSLFNFEILGVNVLGFLSGIITLVIIFLIVKRVFF